MSKNPGERFPKPTVAEQARAATRGTIHYFRPTASILLVLLALAVLNVGASLAALGIAVAAGRLSVSE